MTTPTARDHLEQARDSVWEAIRQLEEAQRILFRAGDCYVAEVWGDGVRRVLEVTEGMAETAGDLSALHIELGRLVQRERERRAGEGAP